MRYRQIAIVTAIAAVLAVGCGSGGVSGSPGATPATRTVADFTGKGLQTAENDARSAGFGNLASHDASGRARIQILDTDWKVCFQTPAAGRTAATSTRLDFGVVKLAESCPASDLGAATPAPVAQGRPLPDFTGRSLNVALTALPASASVTSRDVSGRGRLVLAPANWQVCSQQPAAGTRYTGQPVTFGVVKYGETCP